MIYQHVVDGATRAIGWYLTHRRSKKRWAQILRVGAIFMVTIAGVLPVLSQILSADRPVTIQPAWASVALGIAVALVALDRFFGFSSAWSRYIATEQAISAALNQFLLDWQKVSSKVFASEFTKDDLDAFLDLAKKLAEKTDELVQAETLQWVKEFRETLTDMEQSAQKGSRL